jgi:hypothetical protein
MSHCHCGRCRKAHGSPYVTFLVVREDQLRLTHGRDRIVRYESTPGYFRPFCGGCGSAVPDSTGSNGYVGVPAGPFDGDPGVRPTAHIFAASKAPWFEMHDDLPRFDAYPPGLGDPGVPTREPLDPPGGVRGSCLCGQVTFVVDAPPFRCLTCHCLRCRKASSSANVSNMACRLDEVRFTRGEALLVAFKVPEARFFTTVFCGVCGSRMPRLDRERKLAIIPMGTLDDDPGVRPQAHIFVGSKAAWDEIGDDGLPQYEASFPA